ncbi:MAG: hypothetical protein ACK5QU_07460 [Bacteroidota bacterium]|jgi:hypothetical protein
MDLHLFQGEFTAQDTLDLIVQLINVKIKYHENKILKNNNEEDTKYRESRIKLLQSELAELKSKIAHNDKNLKVSAIIHVD